MTKSNPVDSKIDYLSFYSAFVKDIEEVDENQFTGLCPLHDDNNPSFGFNTITGQWKCYAGCGGGNIFTFVTKKTGLKDKKEIIRWIEEQLGIKLDLSRTIDKSVYIPYHSALLKNHGAMEWLQKERGLTVETIKKYKLGIWGQRITVPILDEDKNCVNLRCYARKGSSSAQTKMINYVEGSGKNKIRYGGIRLYPVSNLIDRKKIIITEGEMDCILLNQYGFNAVTVTGGAGSFRNEWSKTYFKDKNVYICFDIDSAGDKGAMRVAKILFNKSANVNIVQLKTAISEPPNADVTDYFISYGYTAKDFADLLKDSKPYQDLTEQDKKIRSKTYKKVELSKASHYANAMRNLQVVALVSGKNFPPYEIPDKIKLNCDGSYSEKICPFCSMFMEDEFKRTCTLEDEYEHGSILNLIDISDSAMFNNLRKILKIPTRCDRLKVDVETYINIEELSLIPEIDFSADADYEYVTQVAYYMSHGLKTNQVYTFKGLALPDPRTQQATQLYHEAEPAVDSIDQFKMTSDMRKRLEIFQPKADNVDEVFKAYSNRYKDIQRFSGIYDRIDIALTYDIVIHSALQVIFQNKMERGWMESLLIGDSGCGKTELAKSMIYHYKVGEFVTGESASVAGLIGGLSQSSKRWTLNWGKIPLNNRRFLFIDEVSGMSVEDISLFSGIRSSGIAELTKIRTEKTHAQTRKVWVGNPRKIGQTSRNMMEYSYGCVAVRELIGHLEDIRRFDFIVTAHSEEVDTAVYNMEKDLNLKNIQLTSTLCHDLIMWIWSRNKSQIRFQNKAVQAILKYAGAMGKKYYHGIPIVEAADQRLKLMRGAVAIAGLMFSTNKDGNQIVVKECHVDFFYGWLERVYNKDSMRYGKWSEYELSKKVLKDVEKINDIVPDGLIDLLMEADVLNITLLIDMTGWERADIRNLLSTLIRNNALKRVGTSYYRKTEAFITYLNQRKSGTIKVENKGEDGEQPF